MTNNSAILNERRFGMFANAIHKSITVDVFGNDERKAPERRRVCRWKPRKSTEELFQEFHGDNPHVYDRLVYMARQQKPVRHTFYSIKTLGCCLRFEMDLDVQRNSHYKLNDKYPCLGSA